MCCCFAVVKSLSQFRDALPAPKTPFVVGAASPRRRSIVPKKPVRCGVVCVCCLSAPDAHTFGAIEQDPSTHHIGRLPPAHMDF